MTAQVAFNRTKFRELIVYFARRLEPQAALGRVKLAKLLMTSDFSAFAILGRPITGATYEKWEFGHLPRELLLTDRDLQAEGAIEIETVDYYGRQLRHVTARRDPDMSAFTEDELGIVESAIRAYGYASATFLSQLAHQELGWILAADKETIPYESVLLEMTRPPDNVFAEFRALHGIA